MNILNSQEATESCKQFVDDLNAGLIEIDKEPDIGEEFIADEAHLNQRLESYQNFLKSDLCRRIVEICDESL